MQSLCLRSLSFLSLSISSKARIGLKMILTKTYKQTQEEIRQVGRGAGEVYVLEFRILEPYPSFEMSMEGPPEVITIEDFPELLEPAVNENQERMRYEALRQGEYWNSMRLTGSLKLEFRFQARR